MKSTRHDKSDKVNWDVPQLVVNGGVIIMTTGSHSSGRFKGVTLTNYGDFKAGEFSEIWDKHSFVRYEGALTLEND